MEVLMDSICDHYKVPEKELVMLAVKSALEKRILDYNSQGQSQVTLFCGCSEMCIQGASEEDPCSSHEEENPWKDPWIVICEKSGNACPVFCPWMIWESDPLRTRRIWSNHQKVNVQFWSGACPTQDNNGVPEAL